MLKRIKIENLRGIQEGEISGLTRLVVLVGPNGSGKSTVLEGGFIGGSQEPAAAVGNVTSRRSHTWNGARWVIRGGTSQVSAIAEVEWHDGVRWARRVQWDSVLRIPEALSRFNEVVAPGPFSAFRIYQEQPPLPHRSDDKGSLFAVAALAADNRFVPYENEHELQGHYMRLVDPSAGQPLHDLFSRVVQAGLRDDVIERAKMVIAKLEGIEILTEEGQPRLFLTFRSGAVPASLAGDGIQALLRMAFELASPAGGTILLEEPEVHMHPRALYACAKAIVAAVRRDVQVIMTTHSQELIDLLLSELTEDERADPGMMTLCRVQLREGRLSSTLIAASEAVQARMALAEDLR